ncbi:pyridoxal phosphate-dependent aminotransferase [Pedobacter cryophilus]|uniref:Histidinol-phosphate aminotransferase family protein n=1 Tax=Pedobacter cryophilus TaxID=2571271 RepID=A0A4U1BYW8_9SPHI|nr:histidinol-phosphate transaminase [Pedobacter cryophilus]TKB97701.1 histidinol-phosphate aminotransferase family protein [Pedobacter cryophilus]
MANSMNRRSWIRSSAFMAAGITFFSGTFTSAIAKTKAIKSSVKRVFFESDQSAAQAFPNEIKARLLANENPFGPSAKAKKAILDAVDKSYQYPFAHFGELVNKIAVFEGVKPEQIMLDAGSSPILKAAAIHFTKKGGNIITSDPSYDDLPSTAEGFGAQIIAVPLTAEFKLDLDGMEKKINTDTKLVYICNPNNPTATVVDTAKLKAFVERVSAKVPVFIDEAYIDYLDDPQSVTLFSAVKKGQNVIVARTFSKLYGFAGLRVGYAIAQAEMVKTLDAYTNGAMSISATSLMAAIASHQDREFLDDTKKKTQVSKDFLYKTLKEEGYTYIPSFANFVMFPIKMDGDKFVSEMRKRGVGIRNWEFNKQHYCRVSIGTLPEMQLFAEAFKQIS